MSNILCFLKILVRSGLPIVPRVARLTAISVLHLILASSRCLQLPGQRSPVLLSPQLEIRHMPLFYIHADPIIIRAVMFAFSGRRKPGRIIGASGTWNRLAFSRVHIHISILSTYIQQQAKRLRVGIEWG